MKLITCASYGSTGSSAITDFFAEYSEVKSFSDFEFRFLHDPDGVSDLEFQLVQCHNRHNAGRAIKRFKSMSVFNAGTWFAPRYEQYFNHQYLRITEEYIASLVDFQTPGWWIYDILDKGYEHYYLIRGINKLVRKLSLGKIDTMQKERTLYSHPSEESFLSKTQQYTRKLLEIANPEDKKYLILDQVVASQNINRYLRYFDIPVYVYIVDRDPRDLYVWEMSHTTGRKFTDVDGFIKRFKYIRDSGSETKKETDRIHYVKFEDMIYKYTEMKNQLEQDLSLDSSQHIYQFKFFNPKRSVNNTRMWINRNDLSDDIKKIEEELSEFLYPYDTLKTNQEIPGIECIDKTIF